MFCRSRHVNADALPLEIANRVHPVGSNQLEASDMPPGQHDGRVARIQPDEVRTNEVHSEVHSSGRQ
jgi:hypothetical protein